MHVSVVTTRSSVAKSAAVSARSRSLLEPSQMKTSPAKPLNCPDAGPFCNETQLTPGTCNKGTSVLTCMER